VLLWAQGKTLARQSKSVRNLIVSPIRRHSAKPEICQDRIEQLYPAPYLEIFARRPRLGWTCCGNDLDGLDIHDSLYRIAHDQPLPEYPAGVDRHEHSTMILPQQQPLFGED